VLYVLTLFDLGLWFDIEFDDSWMTFLHHSQTIIFVKNNCIKMSTQILNISNAGLLKNKICFLVKKETVILHV